MFAKALLLFASLLALVEAQTTVTGIFDANASIRYWINSNAFVGIILTIIFAMVCYIMLQMLSTIETPKILLEKCIDWGKVEKVEE